MKKIICLCILSCLGFQTFAQDVPEKYLRAVDKISTQYNLNIRNFLRSLDPQITQFNPQQKDQFCGIVNQYISDFYKVTDQNRSALPLSYASMSKQDVIQKVMLSQEMQMLAKYNVNCDFK